MSVRVLPSGQVVLKCSRDGSAIFSSREEGVRRLGLDPEQYRNEAVVWNRDPDEALNSRYEEWQAQRPSAGWLTPYSKLRVCCTRQARLPTLCRPSARAIGDSRVPPHGGFAVSWPAGMLSLRSRPAGP